MREQIRKFILENFLFGEDDDNNNLKDDNSFMDNSIIDSTGILELVSWLQEEFGFEIEDEELIPENLDSINRLIEFIKKKQPDQWKRIE